MRNYFNLLFAFFISIILLFGQEGLAQGFESPVNRKGSFNIGLEGGIQFTGLSSFSSLYNPSSKNGFATGIFGEYYTSNSFKIKLAAIYDNRGFELNSNILFPDTSGQNLSNSYYYYQVGYKANYLTIPIGICFEKGGEKFKLLLNLNFYYSLFLNANMDGVEFYYFDPSDGFDLSGTELNQGSNEFEMSGNTEGATFKDFSTETPSEYNVENFNTSDFGFSLMIGGLYQATPTFGISLSVGFAASLGRAFENPEIDSKWSQMTKINLGVVYTLFKK